MSLTPEQETWVAALEACMAGERDQLACAALIRTQAARIEALEAALRLARGWVITCSSSSTAKRDLKTIDAAFRPALTKDPDQ